MTADRQTDTRRRLGEVEAELMCLRATLKRENRLSGTVRHDLANALMLVMTFRELLGEPAEDDLLDDAAAAGTRAQALAAACTL